MSYGRGFPISLVGNGESSIPENGIGQGSWTAAILGQTPQRGRESVRETPRNYPENGIGQGSWNAAILGQTPQRGRESLGETPRNYPENGIGQGSWNAAILGQTPQRGGESLGETPRNYPENGIGQGSWTAAILGQTPQRGCESLGETPRKYPDYGIGQNGDSWTAAILGGEIPRRGGESLGETLGRPIPVDGRIIRGKEMESRMMTSMGNGIGHRDSRTMVHQVNANNGIGQNGENWNQTVMPTTNMHSQGNRNGSSSWTPVTPWKPIPQRPNVVAGNQAGNDKWEDLVGMYKNLLGEKTRNLNEVAQDHYRNCGNQNRVATTAKQNLNLGPNPKLFQHPDQASPSVSCMLPEDPAIVKPKNSSASGPYRNEPQNHKVHDLDIAPVPDLSSQVGSNLVGPKRVGSMLGKQSPIISGCNSKQVPGDGLPVPYRSCYDLLQEGKKLSPQKAQQCFDSLHDQLLSITSEKDALQLVNQDLKNKISELQNDLKFTMAQHAEECHLAEEKVQRLESEAEALLLKKSELENLITSLEDRIRSLSEASKISEIQMQDFQLKYSKTETENNENIRNLRIEMDIKKEEMDALRNEIVKYEQHVGSLEEQLTQSHGLLQEKEQVVLEFKEREKQLEDQKAEAQKLLFEAEGSVVEAKKRYDQMLISKQLELSKHLKEISQRNDQAINDIRRRYEVEKQECMKLEKEKAEKAILDMEKKCELQLSEFKEESKQQLMQIQGEHTDLVNRIQQENDKKEGDFKSVHREELKKVKLQADNELREKTKLLKNQHEAELRELRSQHEEELNIQKDKDMPPSFELDAVSSNISPLPFTPITPDTQRRLTDNQRVPANNGHESQRNEEADNLCIIGESTSSVVSTTRKGILVSEERDDNPQDIEQERRINSILERSAMNVAQKNMYAGVINNQEKLRTHMQAGNHMPNVPSRPMSKAPNNAMNVLTRNLMMGNAISGQDIWRNGSNYLAQHVSNLEGRVPDGQMVNVDDRRGIKRPYLGQMNPRNLNAMESLYMSQKLMLEVHKKTKMQNGFCTPRPEDNSREVLRRPNGINGNISASQLLNAHMGRVNSTYQANKPHSQPPMVVTQSFQKQPGSSAMQPITERSQKSTQGHGINSVTAMVSWNQPPATQSKDNSRSAIVSKDKMTSQKHKEDTEIQQISFTKPKGGARKQKGVVSVEDLTCMLGALCLYDENDKSKNARVPYRGINAIIPFEPIKKRKPRPKVDLVPETSKNVLVPYRGNNAIIPFEPSKKRKPRPKVDLVPETSKNVLVPYRGNNAIIPFEASKKRKPRPKVHLVPETERLWRLVMGKEGSEDTETLDKDKEKWWEDERRVFRGRADSFIARIVQGDRRFSRWKGSVVDSVIGVFLTQNVSDHLSRSAFMSLAAKFAFKSTSAIQIPSQDGTCVLVEEPTESYEHTRHHNISSSKSAAYQHNRTSEEVILSQDSLDEIRSSSGSNSEAEDQTVGFETSKEPSPVKPMQPERVSMFKELFSHVSRAPPVNDRSQYMHHLLKTPKQIPTTGGVDITMSLQNAGSPGFGLLRESISSLKSGITDGYDTSYLNYQHNNMSRLQVPPQGHHQYDFLSNHQNNVPWRSHTSGVHHLKVNNQPPGKVKGAQKQDSCSENRVSTVDKQNCVEASSKELNNDSHHPLDGPGKNISKGKKGNAEDEKKKAFDWDSLRRNVFLKCEKRERSKDANDSIDYEALRSAHVSEISDAIRERGMNNMLADRIKDFLDRLVKDHGSIDLEWLRDAPPDKAKDYLLSIRGLGLKSVECVRLLTLHHLAFPVDTNVGRIAVRLGWVPLQPLPESLQLHLLEMYPVLESIQKYLWPRLCKLDQLTLYELHYQMITFGKVFCTKSKPNCNACPMRAECRHFASAFASARLALPGPEEKRMVVSDAPSATHTTPPVISRPMPLPPAENNYGLDARFLCEPIIEEPKTPEPETAKLSISDIEDQYYDDDDDIPTIKLDMNEFTMNLQKLQDSMEIQGDMSKALVALNPQAASIPTPKLKNVSRLRTEHQVYELPDSHPILEGLYKREPDDPSHYLLAIWTPGETANSMQPPERGCEAQESGMLCDRTTCFSCNCIKEANSQVVRGTILMPCRTAMRGSFPLNGTYFQVNEMFADHASSLNPIEVPRSWIWNLPRRMVYFGTSVSTIFKGLTTQEIQQCFWRGFVCVRGFDQKTRSPRPLMARLHFPASKLVKTKNEDK